MNTLKDFIKLYPDIIPLEVCEEIIKEKDLKFYPATLSGGKVSKHRNCLVKPLSNKFENIFFNAVGTILKKYGEECSHFDTGLSCEDTGYEHLLYRGSDKGEYKEHIEHFDLHPRVLSISFLLNDDYEGGNFSFFNKEYILEKKTGSAIVFPSNFCFPHAVLPVTKGDRHVVITWIH